MSKYHNEKIAIDGMIFDSQKEGRRYCEQRLLEKAGEISKLRRQERFCLIPSIEGRNGKVKQRAAYYVADFSYYEKVKDGWSFVVEDVKSPATRTDLYKLKKKLMYWRHGIEIREV